MVFGLTGVGCLILWLLDRRALSQRASAPFCQRDPNLTKKKWDEFQHATKAPHELIERFLTVMGKVFPVASACFRPGDDFNGNLAPLFFDVNKNEEDLEEAIDLEFETGEFVINYSSEPFTLGDLILRIHHRFLRGKGVKELS